MGRGKSLHWHVDRLTEAGTVLGAWVFPGGDECDLVVALSSLPAPIAGFGSTDCNRCRAHLLRWPEAMQSIPVVIGHGRDGNERSLHLRI